MNPETSIQSWYVSPSLPIPTRSSLLALVLVWGLALALVGCGNMADGPQPGPSPFLTNTPSNPNPINITSVSPAPRPTVLPPYPAPTAAPTPPTPSPTLTLAPSPTPSSPPTAPTTAVGSEILFLRAGTLMAYSLATGLERQIATNVSEFAATPAGDLLALVRGSGRTGDIWLVERDGTNLHQMTSDRRAEGSLSWSPDGQMLVYASSESDQQRPREWLDWAAWCSASEVRLLNIASETETTFEPGCDPALSPDGRRIAFATPPETVEAPGVVGQDPTTPNVANTIRLINTRGEHGWSFAVARGDQESGRLVYAPAWSPDGTELAYHRFIGYQALVDMNYTEMGDSFEGQGRLVGSGTGWLLPPRFAPAGPARLVITEHDPQNARGWQGYEVWRAQVLRLGQRGEIFLPEGTRETIAAPIDDLSRVTGVAWSPDGSGLAVVLPPGWQADAPSDEATFETSRPGELWRWGTGAPPNERLTTNVDYASPLLWLPSP